MSALEYWPAACPGTGYSPVRLNECWGHRDTPAGDRGCQVVVDSGGFGLCGEHYAEIVGERPPAREGADARPASLSGGD